MAGPRDDQSLAVFVVGPESSGSKLTARIAAHVLGVTTFDEWDGSGWCGHEMRPGNRVCHRSLPFMLPPKWPDFDEWIENHGATHQVRFIVTTRDRSISERSRIRRFHKGPEQVTNETNTAVHMIQDLLARETSTHVHSYETMVLLGAPYLNLLYDFLGVESDFMPEILDGNRPYIAEEPLP